MARVAWRRRVEGVTTITPSLHARELSGIGARDYDSARMTTAAALTRTLVCCAVTLLARPASATAAGRIVLDWSAPEGCPDRMKVIAGIAGLLDQSTVTEGPPLVVHGSIE